MMAACNGTDERLDELIKLSKRTNELLGQLVDLGLRAETQTDSRELKEPAKARKR